MYGEGGSGIVDIIKEEDDIEIHGNGQQMRDYIHVSDVVEALITAGKMRWIGTTDIGTEEAYSVNELMGMFEKDGEYVDKDSGIRTSVAKSATLPWNAKRGIGDYYE